jgi:hypothetical protein
MPRPNSAYAATWARSDQAQGLRDSSPSTLANKRYLYKAAHEDSRCGLHIKN